MLADLEADDETAQLQRNVADEAAMMEATRQEAVTYGVNEKSHGEHGWAGSMARRFE